MQKKPDWKILWLVFYVFLLALCPPLRLNGKTLFAAEIFLLPVYLCFIFNFLKNPKAIFNVPKAWLFLILALIWAYFVGGLSRGNWADIYSQYPLDRKVFGFDPKPEFIRFMRWALILSTPFIIKSFFQKPKEAVFDIGIKALKAASLISALLCIVDYLGWLPVSKFYGFENTSAVWWKNRSFGTFASPLEASLFYGGVCSAALFTVLKGKYKKFDIFVLILNLLALGSCIGATAIIALIATTLWIATSSKIKFKWKYFFTSVAIVACSLLAIFLLQPQLLIAKSGNLSVRFLTWSAWLKSLIVEPKLIFSGIGFSDIVIDSSVLFPFITGGVLLGFAFYNWLYKLFKENILDFNKAPILLFWMISWLTLDSAGYWGIGRLCWLIIGLLWVQSKSKWGSLNDAR